MAPTNDPPIHTGPWDGRVLIGPVGGPDEVVDAREYNRTAEALIRADAAYRTLVEAVKTLSATADGINNIYSAVGAKELVALEELVGIPPAKPEDLE